MPVNKNQKLQNINDSLLTRELYELSQIYFEFFYMKIQYFMPKNYIVNVKMKMYVTF